MGDRSVAVVRGLYEAFAKGEVPAVLGGMTEDMEWNEAEGMPQGGTYRGPSAVAENVFGPITQDVSDFAVTPEEFIASGDTVAALVRYTGTGSKSGKTLDLVAVHIWDVRDDKVSRMRQFADTVKYREVVPG
jgi:uncharacterized protein